MRVTLLPGKLRWIQDAADDPMDRCAHADVEFFIDDEVEFEGATCKFGARHASRVTDE